MNRKSLIFQVTMFSVLVGVMSVRTYAGRIPGEFSGVNTTGDIIGDNTTVVKDISALVPKDYPYIDARHYGADPTGAKSSAPALRAAIAAAPARGATIFFGPGEYFFDSTVRVDRQGIRIRGAGVTATVFRFEPAVKGSAIFLDFRKNPDRQILYDCSLTGLRIYSTDTTHEKIGIRLYDVSAMLIENVTVDGCNGNGSIGLLTQGRDQSTVAKFRSWADIPITIRDNPNSNIDLDHFHFQDTRLLAMNHLLERKFHARQRRG